MLFPPEPSPIEDEIVNFFAQNNFERSRRFSAGAYNPDIIKEFLRALGNPQHKYKTLHIAGTAGKGSMATYLGRGLTAMGFKTGAYLSPHFLSLRERFSVANTLITANELADYWSFLKVRPGIHELSFFDALTALGFLYFAEKQCAWAVIETGLGGRRDSTNNLHAEAAVLTRIGLDHRNILGNSLEEIAVEKAGIIQAGKQVFSVPQEEPAAEVIRQTCKDIHARLFLLTEEDNDYNAKNRSYALQVLEELFHPTPEVKSAIRAACAAPIFGRWTELRKKPRIVFDGGHNPPAMEEIAALVNRQPEAECNFFLNTMRERNLEDFFRILSARCAKNMNFFLFPVNDGNYFTETTFMPAPSEKQITERLQDEHILHIFTGSMGIYKELHGRFGL